MYFTFLERISPCWGENTLQKQQLRLSVRSATGALKMLVSTMRPCHSTVRGWPTLTEMSFISLVSALNPRGPAHTHPL